MRIGSGSDEQQGPRGRLWISTCLIWVFSVHRSGNKKKLTLAPVYAHLECDEPKVQFVSVSSIQRKRSEAHIKSFIDALVEAVKAFWRGQESRVAVYDRYDESSDKKVYCFCFIASSLLRDSSHRRMHYHAVSRYCGPTT